MKKLFKVVMPIFALFILFSGASYGYLTTDPAGACNFLDPGSASYIENAFLIDVRTPSEWLNDGHAGMNDLGAGSFLEGKVFNIAWLNDLWQSNENFFDEVSSQFENGDTLIIMCKSGGRSASAADALVSLATGENMTIYNMLTGFTGWKSSSLPYNFDPAGVWEPSCEAPIPPSILMLAPALIGLLGAARRKRK